MSNIDNDADPQDRAEVLDETNLTADGRNIANFDDVPEVYDATAQAGDSVIDEPAGEDPAEDVPEEKDPHVDRQLDKGLKETFPASDPVSINPGAD